MAYTVTVNKGNISQISPTEFNVSVDVLIVDGETTVLEKMYSKRYKTGDTMTMIKTALLNMVSADWTKFLAEKALYDNAAYGTMCSQMQTTINSSVNV